MQPPIAALTGGTGFLGRHLIDVLTAAGWRVRMLTRRDPVDPLRPGLDVDLVLGDLHDGSALHRLCSGAEAVIHAAGLIKARDRSAFERVNVEGAAALAEAARAAAPDAPVLLVSSLAAREPHLSTYAGSKRRGEDAVQRVLGGRATVVRPPIVYGPGDRESLDLFRRLAPGPLAPIPNPRGRVAMIHAVDAARQIEVLARGRFAGATLSLSDRRPDGYSWEEIVTTAAGAVGARPRTVRLPPVLLRAAGVAGGFAQRLGADPFLTSGKVAEALHPDWSVAADPRDPVAPAPRFDLPAGFEDAVAWYRSVGWLPQSGVSKRIA